MNKDFMDPELTEEEKRETILANEDDYLEGLLAAADDAANDTKKIDIIRNERRYFSFSIHSLTDKAKLWDNPAVKKGLEAKGICIINALDVIDAVLLPGEKDRIMDIIDDVNGFNNEELKAETAKN